MTPRRTVSKSNGFTLMELIAVTILIGVVGVIATPANLFDPAPVSLDAAVSQVMAQIRQVRNRALYRNESMAIIVTSPTLLMLPDGQRVDLAESAPGVTVATNQPLTFNGLGEFTHGNPVTLTLTSPSGTTTMHYNPISGEGTPVP